MRRPEPPSVLIDQKIRELGDWRGKMLAKVRTIIHAADPEMVEEWKWNVEGFGVLRVAGAGALFAVAVASIYSSHPFIYFRF